MPAKSEKQKIVACMALAMKKGKLAHSRSAQAHKMMQSMSMEQLEDMCKLPMMKGEKQMAVTVSTLNGLVYHIGLSTDTKPTGVPIGTAFIEYDTGSIYICSDGSTWFEQYLQ